MANVLIVDDDCDTAELAKLLLESDGYEVHLACNGEEGMRQIQERLPDIVILDIEMPVLDGPAMARLMFLHDQGMEDIPIVLSSGALSLAAVARELGTPYALSKPYRYEALSRMMQRALVEKVAPTPVVATAG